MSENDNKKPEAASTESSTQGTAATDTGELNDTQQKATEASESGSLSPEAAPAIDKLQSAVTSPTDGEQNTNHRQETSQNPPPEQQDKHEVSAHDIPPHSVPPTTATEGNIPPHEVPQHSVPPVNRPQAAQPPAPASPDQMVEPNLVNRAVDVIASSSSQRDAVQRSFELQRATIAHGIKSRRDAAMEQAAAAKASIGQQHATMPQQGATSMNQQYAAPPQPQAAPAQQYQAAPQPGIATHPGMAGYTGAAPLSNNEIIAQEFAMTLRQIIAEEVDKQLKALLAAYTSADPGTPESPVE